MYPLKQSTALDVLFFAHDANGDAVTGKVDGDFTKRISKGGGVFAAMTVTITERENGWYHAQLSTSHTDTLGVLSVTFTATGLKQVNLQFRVHARLPDDLAFPATSGRSITVETDGMVHADLKEWLGTAPLALASQKVQSDPGSVTVGTNNDKTGYRLSATGVDDVWDEAQSGHTTAGTFGKFLDVEVSSRNATTPPTAGAIADQVWDEARADHTGAGSFGQGVALTSGERDSVAAALLDLAAGVETNRTVRQTLRLLLAALAGKLSGAATTTVAIRDTNDSKDRITATVDANGNRTAVTYDAT